MKALKLTKTDHDSDNDSEAKRRKLDVSSEEAYEQGSVPNTEDIIEKARTALYSIFHSNTFPPRSRQDLSEELSETAIQEEKQNFQSWFEFINLQSQHRNESLPSISHVQIDSSYIYFELTDQNKTYEINLNSSYIGVGIVYWFTIFDRIDSLPRLASKNSSKDEINVILQSILAATTVNKMFFSNLFQQQWTGLHKEKNPSDLLRQDSEQGSTIWTEEKKNARDSLLMCHVMIKNALQKDRAQLPRISLNSYRSSEQNNLFILECEGKSFRVRINHLNHPKGYVYRFRIVHNRDFIISDVVSEDILYETLQSILDATTINEDYFAQLFTQKWHKNMA